MAVKPWRRAQVIGTREHLIETALSLFAEQGFAGTPLERVVREAGLTRGAVYHHFSDKRDLFAAVTERVLRDLVFGVEKALVKSLARGRGGASEAAELLAAELARPEVHRVLSLDGPAVLGHERFGELLGRHLLPPLERIVESADGPIPPPLVRPLAQLLFGAVQEAARQRAAGSPAKATRAALRLLVDRVLA